MRGMIASEWRRRERTLLEYRVLQRHSSLLLSASASTSPAAVPNTRQPPSTSAPNCNDRSLFLRFLRFASLLSLASALVGDRQKKGEAGGVGCGTASAKDSGGR